MIKYDDLSSFMEEVLRDPAAAKLQKRRGKYYINGREVDKETWYQLMTCRVKEVPDGQETEKE